MDDRIRKLAWDSVSSAYSGPCTSDFLALARETPAITGRELLSFVPRQLPSLQADISEKPDWRSFLPTTLRETHAFVLTTWLQSPFEHPGKLHPWVSDVVEWEFHAPHFERVHFVAPPGFVKKAKESEKSDMPMLVSSMVRRYSELGQACRFLTGSAGLCDSLFAVLVDMDIVLAVCRKLDYPWRLLMRHIRTRLVRLCKDLQVIPSMNPPRPLEIRSGMLDYSLLDHFEIPFPGIVAAPCVTLMDYGIHAIDQIVVPVSLAELAQEWLPETQKAMR